MSNKAAKSYFLSKSNMKNLALLFSKPNVKSLALLAVILAFLFYYKLEMFEHLHMPSIDGGYYTNIARHVRDGDGLKTNISLYHQAYHPLPYRTSISPLWPLIYGYTARIMPLLDVGFILPGLFYFLALFFAYNWASRLFKNRQIFPHALPGFNAGHIAVLMLGLHEPFFHASSLPYTEGLAYALVFIFLFRFHSVIQVPGIAKGLEAGIWLGLIFLARSQLVIVSIAVFFALGYGVIVSNKKPAILKTLIFSLLIFCVLLGLHYFYIKDSVADKSPLVLLRFDTACAGRSLSEHNIFVPTDGIWDYITDRAQGFLVAFKLTGKYSYSRVFYLYQYSLIAALPFLLITGIRNARLSKIKNGFKWLGTNHGIEWLFLTLLASGGFLSIYTLHKNYYNDWNFAARQGLTAIFIFFFAMIFLLRHRKVPAVMLGVFILCSGTYLGYKKIEKRVEYVVKASKTKPENYKVRLVNWLKKEHKRQKNLTVAISSNEAQKIAFLVPGVNFHWVYKNRTTDKDIETLIKDFDVDYILVTSRDRTWKKRRKQTKFVKLFKPGKINLSGFSVLIPKKFQN